MKIAQISNVSMRPLKGNLYLNNMQTSLSDNDYLSISEIEQKIKNEPYDITLTKNQFGQIHTSVMHNNGKSVSFGPINFPVMALSVPQYINSIINLININKKERTN